MKKQKNHRQGKQNAEVLPEPTGASRDANGENFVNGEKDTTIALIKAPAFNIR